MHARYGTGTFNTLGKVHRCACFWSIFFSERIICVPQSSPVSGSNYEGLLLLPPPSDESGRYYLSRFLFYPHLVSTFLTKTVHLTTHRDSRERKRRSKRTMYTRNKEHQDLHSRFAFWLIFDKTAHNKTWPERIFGVDERARVFLFFLVPSHCTSA